MLVLSRKPGEKVIIGNGITLTILAVSGNQVRVGIDAPHHVRILRAELDGWQRGPLDGDDRLNPDWKANPDWSETAAVSAGQEADHR